MPLTRASLRAERMSIAVDSMCAAVRISFSYSYRVGQVLLLC